MPLLYDIDKKMCIWVYFVIHAVVQSRLQKAKNGHLSVLITPADKLSLRISIGIINGAES